MRNEEDLQKAVAQYLDLHPKTRGHWFHPPNEGQRHPAVGAKLKRLGMRAGLPDCMCFRSFRSMVVDETALGRASSKMMSGLAIELKMPKNYPTPAQRQWHQTLRNCGWRVQVCRSLDEVMEVVEQCYGKTDER